MRDIYGCKADVGGFRDAKAKEGANSTFQKINPLLSRCVVQQEGAKWSERISCNTRNSWLRGIRTTDGHWNTTTERRRLTFASFFSENGFWTHFPYFYISVFDCQYLTIYAFPIYLPFENIFKSKCQNFGY